MQAQKNINLFSFFLNKLRKIKSIALGTAIDHRVSIGKYTYGLSRKNFLLFRPDDRVKIGNFCSFAAEVLIVASGEHNYKAVSTFPFYAHFLDFGPERDTNSKGEISIGNDVWVGARATILSGVKIDDGAVIAAGSVVIGDVPAYSIVAGVPAAVVKYRFSPEKIQELLNIEWWEWSDENIKDRIDDFYNMPELFISKYKVS